LAAFWLLLAVMARSVKHARGPLRAFVLTGCVALAVGTLQGPVQAFPAVNELLDRGGDAGDVIVNLHAQLNMLGGLMVILIGFSAYARAAWRMTSRQRAAGREELRTAPARYTGKIPRRVRRRSPAALAGYELPLAVMGFPGVGWLFAGFPFTASILLMVGPA